jgi:spermidine synthase
VDQPRRPKAAVARAAARRPESRTAATRPWLEVYVLAASFLAGAIVLVVEILGTRVVSPYYGASIYVWSSLIGVTLGALTAGYVIGGWAADRWPALMAFAAEMVGGALYLLLVPWLRKTILMATTPLGLKAGSLVSATLLFGAPLALLGMTGPSAIRLVTTDFTFLGRGVGKVYGVSTLGSMLGAILTGFVLIPSFAVSTLLIACAVVLLAVGGLGLMLARRTLGGAAALAAAVLAAGSAVHAPLLATNVLHVGNSFHGEIKVVDVKANRILLIDGVDNGFVDRVSMDSRAPYIASFDYLPIARPGAKRALCIGLGAGSVPRTFHLRHGIATEVVEIDPEIVRIAHRYFGFPADIPVIVEDGRTYVERTPERYDFVVLDAFHAETHPAHLFTREFFARVDAILVPGGVLAINTAGLPEGPGSVAWRSVQRTLAERFAYVRSFAGVPRESAATRFTNLFMVASQEALPTPAGDPALATLARNEIKPGADDAVVLTDDYNPVDDLQRSVLVAWREDVIRQSQSVLLFDGAR